jgi:mannose-1-phosphate guanylyltransferase / mannose-6-phosphate isomerase
MKPIIPVILSGGAGTRLWPLSTPSKPKQFHALNTDISLFSETIERVKSGQSLKFGAPIIVCGRTHEALVRSELMKAQISNAQVILEPMPRNTAPALAAAALLQAETDDQALMLVLPADHVIAQPQRLHQACADAHQAALAGRIVTFAIKPLGPETGYGYIKSGEALAPNVHVVEAFKEKPDAKTAQDYLDQGSYSWNAGIFFFKASALISELEIHAPLLLQQARAALKVSVRLDGSISLDPTEFAKAPSISIDYAVMEPTSHAAVVPVDMGWSDVGSYTTLWELSSKDVAGNYAKGNAALIQSSGCYVDSQNVPVALIGVTDLVVICTPEGILVSHRDSAQDVRLAAEALKKS